MKLLLLQHKMLKGFLISMQNKERLDKYLTDLGYFETKSKAASAILAGNVKINDEYITKAGFQINLNKEYDIQVKSMPYVSRGGFKLKKALDTFNPIVKDRVCFDAGASTGGLQIVYYKMVLNTYMQSMLDMVNWTGKFAQINVSKQLKKLILRFAHHQIFIVKTSNMLTY